MPNGSTESSLTHEVAQLEQWLRENTGADGEIRFEIQQKLKSKIEQLNKRSNDYSNTNKIS